MSGNGTGAAGPPPGMGPGVVARVVVWQSETGSIHSHFEGIRDLPHHLGLLEAAKLAAWDQVTGQGAPPRLVQPVTGRLPGP